MDVLPFLGVLASTYRHPRACVRDLRLVQQRRSWTTENGLDPATCAPAYPRTQDARSIVNTGQKRTRRESLLLYLRQRSAAPRALERRLIGAEGQAVWLGYGDGHAGGGGGHNSLLRRTTLHQHQPNRAARIGGSVRRRNCRMAQSPGARRGRSATSMQFDSNSCKIKHRGSLSNSCTVCIGKHYHFWGNTQHHGQHHGQFHATILVRTYDSIHTTVLYARILRN